MKILIISAAFPPMPAGEATNTFYLAKHLADRGFEVHILTSENNNDFSDPRLRIHPLMSSWSWSEVPRLARFLKRCSPDAILLMYLGWIYQYHPMITFAPTLSKRLLPRVPFVTRFENALGAEPAHNSLLTRIIRKGIAIGIGKGKIEFNFGSLLRDSDRIIVLSDYHRAVLSRVFRETTNKSVLIPPPPNMRVVSDQNGSSRKKGRKILGVEDGHFLLAFIGYFYPSKGIETLFRAFRLVCDRTSHVRLVLIGGSIAPEAFNGPDSSYFGNMAELAKELGIDKRLIWTGAYNWDSESTSDYFHAADACVLPFDYGVHLNNSSLASAASHGLPIITTEGEGMDKPFIHQKNVFLCPPKSPEAIAAAIKVLMENGGLRKCLSLGALELSQEWFSWEKAIDRTVATLCGGAGEDRRTSGGAPI
jgi:polysaccharide biosynthesis protein PslF